MLRPTTFLVVATVGGCWWGPLKAGDPCDVDDCPDAFVCEPDDAGALRCHVRVGGACDGTALTDQFCAAETACAEAPGGGPGDAVCGGVGSTCPQERCAEGLACVDATCLRP